MTVSLKDFQPINTWEPDLEGPRWSCCKKHLLQPKLLIDQSTQKRYLKESRKTLRLKSLLLTVSTPIVHTFAPTATVAYQAYRFLKYPLTWSAKENTVVNRKVRLKRVSINFLKIVMTPISLVGLELAAIYGIFNPNDGRKLYASMERLTYNSKYCLAPCFQPEPTSHAFGGDINKKNAF